MKRTCWIIYNGFLPGDKFLDFAEMIYDAAKEIGHEPVIYKNNELISYLHTTVDLLYDKKRSLPDYIVFTDKDIYLAKQLEMLGIPVFNSAYTIEVSDDKIKTYQLLAEQHIPMPKTMIAPKTFGLSEKYDEQYFRLVIDELQFPLIIKEAFGSFGEQVYFIENERALREKVAKIHDRPFVFQQFIETSYGKDIRVQVVGDQVVTAMKRTSLNDFRANVTSGGKMIPYMPNEREKEIAIRASQAIHAHFSGVDLLFGNDNEPIVCEVNSNAHIRNLLDCTGVNAANNIVQYIESYLRDHEC